MVVGTEGGAGAGGGGREMANQESTENNSRVNGNEQVAFKRER